MLALEPVLREETFAPDFIPGDVRSTLAPMTVAELGMRVDHLEAGTA
jgi:hypothetical protein